MPPDCDLKPALVGTEHTIVISNQADESARAIEILDLLSSIDIFSNFALARSPEFIEAATHCGK